MKKDRKRRVKTALKITAVTLILLVVFSFAANAAVTGVYGKLIDTAPQGEKFDCILILGAKVFSDGSVSAMLSDRLDCGIELYFAGVSDKILVSGDHGTENYDEVNAMKAYCVARGVPSENIFMDHAGFSTYDSVVRAKKVFLCESVIIVTQKYHLFRALFIANSIGLHAYGASAAPTVYAGNKYREAREFLARVKDIGSVVFRVSPAYLGSAVPISENGDVTNDK